MPELDRPQVMLDILEEHFEELDFLWEQREGVVFAPDWSLAELAELEERAEAHLDGLRIGAAHSADIARPVLACEEKNLAAAAALTLMALGSPPLEKEVVAALATSAPAGRDGLRIGLRHSDVRRVAEDLARLAASGDPPARAAAADVLAFHRLPVPPRFAELLAVPDPEVRRLAYGAAGRFGGPWSLDYLQDALRGASVEVRLAALHASARLGVPLLAETCRRAAAHPQSPSPEALAFLGVLGEPHDLQVLQAALQKPALVAAALDGLGALGRTAAIPALLQAMKNPALTRAAGAAFIRITGAAGIEADRPLPPADLPEDEKDFWDDTRPPDPDRAQAFWDRMKGRFTPEGRWQAGREAPKAPFEDGFDTLPLQTRRDLYFGARAADPVRIPDRELEGRARRQSGDR